MLSSDTNKDIQQYLEIKKTCPMSFKINMLFFILESIIYPKQYEKCLNSDEVKYFRALLKSLEKQTHQENAQFLKINMQFLRDILAYRQDPNHLNNPLSASIISTIDSQCNICETFMKVSYWSKAKFKLNKQSFTINIITKNKQYRISLKQYFVRKSRRLKNVLVLQSNFDLIGQHQKKHVLQFKNNAIFDEIYENLRECIIKITQKQILKLLGLEENQQEKEMCKALALLTNKTITKYFQEKDKVMHKLSQNKIKFKHLIDLNRCKIHIGKKQNGNHYCYKLQRNYSLTVPELRQKLNLFNRQKRGNMIYYETVQKFSQNIELGYFKYFIQHKNLEFLTIFEDVFHEKSITTVIKGIDNILVNKIIEFIIVKVEEKNLEETDLTIFAKFQFEKMNSKDQENMINAFLIDLTEPVEIYKQEDISENQTLIFDQRQYTEDFYSVRGSVHEQDMQDLYEYSIPFEKEYNESKQENDTFSDLPNIVDGHEFIGDDSHQFHNSQKQSCLSQSRQISSNNDSPMKKKSQQHPTCQSDQKEQDYLTYKWNVHPLEKIGNFQLMQQHHLFKSFARCKRGGVYDIDKPVIEEQKKVFMKILKQMGNKIFKLQSVATISLPVEIFKTQSHLKTVARNHTYVPLLVEKVVKEEPLIRFKRVIEAVVGMEGLGLVNQKPFNPTLGQTYQGRIDGCPIVLEQISHHPPICSYHFQGRGYYITGQVEPKIRLGPDSLHGYNDRPAKIVFQDGMAIQYKQSTMLINGMIFQERSYTFQGKSYFFDQKNNIFAMLQFGPKKFYIFKSDEEYDIIYGQIYKVKEGFIDKFKQNERKDYPKPQDIIQVLAKCQGIWNQHFIFDGVETINYTKQMPCQLIDQKIAIPSDSHFRSDLQSLILGKMQESQKNKQKIEEQQRYFRKLREKKKK